MKPVALLISFLVLSIGLQAQTVTVAWDANTDSTIGYTIKYGTSPGIYITSIDVPGEDTTSKRVTLPTYNTKFYFVMFAYNTTLTSLPSAEVPFTTGDNNCLPPFGVDAITITPTQLRLTGSKGPGSDVEVYFLLQSKTGISHVAIKMNGSEIPDSIIPGNNLQSSLGVRFKFPATPSGMRPLSIYAQNLASCASEKLTSFALGIP